MYKFYKAEKDMSLFPKVQNKQIQIDWKLYEELLKHRAHSATKAEKRFGNWLSQWIMDNVEGAKIERDKIGNIYVTKGEADIYPCSVAHQDINQDEDIKNVQIINT